MINAEPQRTTYYREMEKAGATAGRATLLDVDNEAK
jgi:hypothetical protein